MSEQTIDERLRQARAARGESREDFARRAGLRIEIVAAIEEGRFGQLPAGLYARAAIRAYATTAGLDPDSTLASCAAFLPAVDDPILALRRLRGEPARGRSINLFRSVASGPTAVDQPRAQRAECVSEWPGWRALAASAVDAVVISVILIAAITGTVAVGVPVTDLRGAAGPFLALTTVLATSYFITFAGLVGQTVGEYAFGVSHTSAERALDARAVISRTASSMFRETYLIERTGEWMGRIATDWHRPWGARLTVRD